jgi:hypothetical protein
VISPPTTATEVTAGSAVRRFGYYSVDVRGGSLTANTDDGRQVRFTFAEDDTFSRDGVQVGLVTFERSWGRSLIVYETPKGRRFNAVEEETPGGGLTPVAVLSADGATVEVSYPYQPEVQWSPRALHVTTDDPTADDALWHATYSSAAPVLDEDAGLWRVDVAAPETPGEYTYRVLTNLGKYRYEWAWGYTTDPVELTDATPRASVRYTGGWTIESVTDDAVTASQGDLTRTFALAPTGGTVPPDTIDLREDARPGQHLIVDYREGADDNLLALTGPAADGWPITAQKARYAYTDTDDGITVSWTNPVGRAITGVRLLSLHRSPYGVSTSYSSLARSADPSLLRAGARVSLTLPPSQEAPAGTGYSVVLEGTSGLSSCQEAYHWFDYPGPTGTPMTAPPTPSSSSLSSPTAPQTPPPTAEPTSPPVIDFPETASSESMSSASPTTSP